MNIYQHTYDQYITSLEIPEPMNVKIFAIIFALWSPTLLSSSIAQGIELKTVSKPWVRVNQTINHLRLDPKNKFAAFIDSSGLGLKVLDLKDKAIYQVSKAQNL